MSSQCRDCREGLQHCHGALVHHAMLRPECTEADCTSPDVGHAFSLDCSAIGCTCARTGAVRAAFAV
jgi:hypothetical protein